MAGNPWDSDLLALAFARMDPRDPAIPVDPAGTLVHENEKAVPVGTGMGFAG